MPFCCRNSDFGQFKVFFPLAAEPNLVSVLAPLLGCLVASESFTVFTFDVLAVSDLLAF